MNRPRLLMGVLVVVLAFVAYAPALDAPFDFDDMPGIADNVSIRSLSPAIALRPPGLGSPVSNRPVANYTFALNYAINERLGIAQSSTSESREQTIGYHIVNILLHAAAALLLFVLVRWTIAHGRVPDDWRSAADRIAGATALLWLLHPIQTEAVAYVVQRTELLVSVCYLAALCAAITAWRSVGGAGIRWSVAAVVAMVLGLGSKEVMITCPFMIILYDRAFLAESWSAPWRNARRRWLYVPLLAASVVAIALVALEGRGGTAGFGSGVPWYRYLYTQAWAIPHYVQLLLWPDALAFDYGRNLVGGLRPLVGFVALSVAFVATIVAWRNSRWHWLAFVGSWFFLLLAPSSSVIPIRTEIGAERRVYLASAAVFVLIVVAVEYARRALRSRVAPSKFVLIGVFLVYAAVCGWTATHVAHSTSGALLVRLGVGALMTAIAWAIAFSPRRAVTTLGVSVLAIMLVGATAHRSAQYRNLVTRWTDAVAKTPTNGRAYDNLASALLRTEPPQITAADSVLHRAMVADSGFVPARVRAATIAFAENRFVDAETLLVHALRLHPGDAAATEQLGKVLLAEGRPNEAIRYLADFAGFSPNGQTLTNLGIALLRTRQLDSAIATFRLAVRFDPLRLDARRYLGATLVEQERGSEAITDLEQAVQLDPSSGVTSGLLAVAYAQAGRADAADSSAKVAAANAGDDARVYVFAGRAMQTVGRFADAKRYLLQALQINANDPEALRRLAMVEAASKR